MKEDSVIIATSILTMATMFARHQDSKPKMATRFKSYEEEAVESFTLIHNLLRDALEIQP